MKASRPIMAVCNMLSEVSQPMQNVEHFQSDSQIQNDQHFKAENRMQNEETCANCCTASAFAVLCHSCSNTVCNMCMARKEGCCIECLKTFPVSPSHPMTRMSSTAGDSLITWLTELANSDQASPVHLPQKQRIELNECITLYAATSCAHVKGSDSESTAVSWADMSESEGSIASSEPPTTMMICNIPCRFGQTDVVEAIHSIGFAGLYDFVYLPSRSGKHNANIGYAFVEFKSAETAERFACAFDNFQFPGTKSAKRCTVKQAHQQGLNAAATNRRSQRA